MKEKPTIIYFQPEYGQKILCTFRTEKIPWAILKEIKDWTDKKVSNVKAGIWIKRINKDENPPKYNINIRGRGEDDRCTWCRSFRTALATKIQKDLKINIKEIGSCDFEKNLAENYHY